MENGLTNLSEARLLLFAEFALRAGRILRLGANDLCDARTRGAIFSGAISVSTLGHSHQRLTYPFFGLT